jgi:hypothetical protein
MQRMRRWLWVVVALGMAGGAGLMVSGRSPSGGVLEVLFAPGIIGYMLVGGVHGGESAVTLGIAYVVANGVVWGCIAWYFARVAQRRSVRRKDSAK